ncbi:hypothetical protein EUGRSUZ_L01522 [Eucalyptus grandis]|uniref:CBF1-interacting co-repressor CIR N-terminal domain-containing protein n=1 Tax=Eucalyptus grandis TaxID=71139 RepID=A0A058ZV58_EUCGR|nr:hypothetical protein EUGRSUZ_L01522 [Eucalyptus grandis]
MDGHGGLNILPQKRWNVYNYENREKVQKDEEAAVKEEQLKREQARKHNAEFVSRSFVLPVASLLPVNLLKLLLVSEWSQLGRTRSLAISISLRELRFSTQLNYQKMGQEMKGMYSRGRR